MLFPADLINQTQINSTHTKPDDLLTGTKHPTFSTNHLTDIDKTKHNCNQQQHRKPKQLDKTRKPCCRKETARCRKCSFPLKFANNIHYKYKKD